MRGAHFCCRSHLADKNGMHQTFYIDIDEEITSVVERIKSSRSNEVVIVVPKRALLIQSIVNLRLLKKEADALGISLSIITQDNLGKIMVEKAGISYQEKLDDSRDDEISSVENKIGEGYFNNPEFQGINAGFSSKEKGRLDKIGTDSYFDANAEIERVESKNEAIEISGRNVRDIDSSHPSSEKIVNKELVSGIADDIKSSKKQTSAEPVFPVPMDGIDGRKKSSRKGRAYLPVAGRAPVIGKNLSEIKIKTHQNSTGDKKIDSFFQSGRYYNEPLKNKKKFKDTDLSAKIRRFSWIFGIMFILVLVGAAAYLFIPKASVLVLVKTAETAQDIEVKGDVNLQAIDYQNETIPAKSVSATAEVSASINSSGSKSLSSQKATGTITIYNEFSSADQPLVATTRFESGDGKIFRLEQGVTVPGTTNVNGETKTGAIEAKVVADAPGEEYNIDAGKFSIPGFKGSGNDKYNKIYAQSSKSMTGGGNTGSGGESKAITDADINNAKSKILAELNDAVKNNIKNSAGDGMIVLDDAINAENATYTLSNSAGETVDKFDIKGQIKASAIVFKEDDLKNIVGKVIANSGNGKVSLDGSSISITYGKAILNYDAGTIDIKAHGVSRLSPDINIEELKKGILGKSNDEIGTYMETYPDIAKADVTYWPPFMNKRIPLYEKRVEVKIEPVDSGG